MGPKDDFDRVPKNDTVNMRTTRGPRYPPGVPPGEGGGGRHLSCLGGAQLQAQDIKEISTMLGLTIQTAADDISKSLSFYTLASIVTDAHFNKGGFPTYVKYL